MIITTTHNIQGMTISHYFGIVIGKAILVSNVAEGFEPDLGDFYELSEDVGSKLIKAVESALKVMEEKAKELGANAVVGVDIKYENLGVQTAMSMVTAFGTAVLVY